MGVGGPASMCWRVKLEVSRDPCTCDKVREAERRC